MVKDIKESYDLYKMVLFYILQKSPDYIHLVYFYNGVSFNTQYFYYIQFVY